MPLTWLNSWMVKDVSAQKKNEMGAIYLNRPMTIGNVCVYNRFFTNLQTLTPITT